MTSELKISRVYKGDVIFEPGTGYTELARLLVAIPSPRDIPEVKEAIDDLEEYDKVWFKYWRQEAEPYKHIRRYFLRHKRKYTHLAILPDDLVVTYRGVDRLCLNVWREPEKYKVLMGNCAVEYGSPFCAVTKNVPCLYRRTRTYKWYRRDELQEDKGIIQVQHAGTPFAILSRDVVEKVSFNNDRKWNDDTVGFSEDVVLSNELHDLGIPIHVDTSVWFEHLKGRKDIPPV